MLNSLASQDRPLNRLIVVDNDPSPENEGIVRRDYPSGDAVEYIPAPENLGPAGGIALGMDRVLQFAEDRDWIVLVDDDDPPFYTTLLRDLKRFGESMLAQDPRTAGVGRVGARFDWMRARLIAMDRMTDDQDGDAIAVDVIGGGHFPFYLAAAVRAVGPFASELFFGGEELEYGLRLRKAGFSLYADASLWRQAQRADGKIGLDVRPSLRLSEFNWRRYYDLRNLLHMLRSFHRTGTAIRILLIRGLGKPLGNLLVNPAVAVTHLKMNLRASRDAWLGRMGRTIEPGTDGSSVTQGRSV